MTRDFQKQAITLIDDLKGVCANYGLGNDGNEFKIITQIFLYKFLNDKFAHEIKQIDPRLAKAASWEDALRKTKKADYEMLLLQLGGGTARLRPEHFLASLYARQNEPDFAKTLDATLLSIAALNSDIFSVMTDDGEKQPLFDAITEFVSSKRNDFARALVNKLVNFSFERLFSEKFDFFATLFEYLIKDYNKDGGGKYAEYYTPHAVAKIMASCLVTKEVKNVSCYDPAGGSGTLLMSLAHAIGEDRCSIYSQDISQKSSGLLRLNLILNKLVHSIPNIIQGNTILHPYHRDDRGALRKFDCIVSNPPFKLDFSDFRDELDTEANRGRFFAGIPKVPNKDKDKMAIYLLFLQHIIHSLGKKGKAAVVVPTGFITAQAGIDKGIRQH
jgi:type I restriction enzyme M protein